MDDIEFVFVDYSIVDFVPIFTNYQSRFIDPAQIDRLFSDPDIVSEIIGETKKESYNWLKEGF